MKYILMILLLSVAAGVSAASNIKGEVAHPVKHFKYTFE